MNQLGTVSVLAALVMVTGCSYPAQLVWSPDGSRAAYRVGADAYLIEHTGRVVRELGNSTGGFAWSGDGRRLYYALARRDDRPTARSPVRREWFAGPKPPVEPTAARDTAELYVLDDGDELPRLICRLGGHALHVSLSPDEAWLAVLVALDIKDESEEPNDDEEESGNVETHDYDHDDNNRISEVNVPGAVALYAVSLRSGRVHLLAYPAFFGMAFTGPGGLAYVERTAGPWGDPLARAKLVEAALDPGSRRLRRGRPYGDVGFVTWLRPEASGDLLILSVPWAAAKAAAARGDGGQPPATLYRLARATGELQFVADGLAPLLSVSPDGRRLLAARVNPPATPEGAETQELVLMSADGGHVRVVRRMENAPFTLWPSWRDADHFLLASEEPVGHNGETDVTRYAVEEYRVDAGAVAVHVRTLSADWDDAMLPFVQNPKFDRKVATQPSSPVPVGP